MEPVPHRMLCCLMRVGYALVKRRFAAPFDRSREARVDSTACQGRPRPRAGVARRPEAMPRDVTEEAGGAPNETIGRLDAVTDTALAHLSLDALLDELLARVRRIHQVPIALNVTSAHRTAP
jgi:hypothetical protein